jgi:hypothetical protein
LASSVTLDQPSPRFGLVLLADTRPDSREIHEIRDVCKIYARDIHC